MGDLARGLGLSLIKRCCDEISEQLGNAGVNPQEEGRLNEP
jgi:hypothetical protein